MAGDWIKIEHGLLNKPEVMLLADALDVSHFEAVGHLVAFWLWVDLNLSPSCPQVKGTKKGLDRVAGRDGFADALVSVGWLKIEDDLISIPGYEVHLSKSAKERAKEQKKKASQRSKASPKMSPQAGDKSGTEQGTREEKRREEDLDKYIAACKHAELLAEGVICPEWLKAEFCRWLAYREAVDGRKVPFQLQEQWIYELNARGEDKALADIAFSISKQAKNICNCENDFSELFKKRMQASSAQSGGGTAGGRGNRLRAAEELRKAIEEGETNGQ